MKYAIMSDVHANPKALNTALDDARRLGCGKFIMLGDVTGYGYDPKESLEIVRKNFDVVLMGNHDSACVGLEPEWEVMTNNNYDLDRMAREQLTEEELQWLREREYLYEEAGFACAHGDFSQPRAWNYIFCCEAAERNFLSRTDDLMFCGHTHVAAIWERTAKGVCRPKLKNRFAHPAAKVESVSFRLNPTSRYIVNVGSVGYPRNDLCCSYGIYDADARRMTVRRLPFDFKSYILAMLDRKLQLPFWLLRLLSAAQATARE
ncbi:MAG: metallophosphoesterase family protein [Kiritimatiellae bacterium]|nr:metallophosphoesterase family protein [Kiritimatiellia bacterium]